MFFLPSSVDIVRHCDSCSHCMLKKTVMRMWNDYIVVPFMTLYTFLCLYDSALHFHSSTVCLLLSFSTGRLFTLPAVFTVHLLPPFLPPSIPPFISPQTLAFSPGSSGEGGNNYYVNKYACCNHIRATDPIRELIAGG